WSAIRSRRGRYLRRGPGVEVPPASRRAPGLARIRAGGDARVPCASAVLAAGRRAAHRLPARCLEPARAAAPRAVDRARAPRGRRRGSDSAHPPGLLECPGGQAPLPPERAGRGFRGAGDRGPRFLEGEVVARPASRGATGPLARRVGGAEAGAARDARRYLREIA